MRKNMIWSAIFALFIPVTLLTSCQSDDELVSGKAGGEGATLSVDVNYPGFGVDSRTGLEEIDGNMIGSWAAGDKLLVSDASGKNVGTLELVDGAGTKYATFSGNLSDELENGTYRFNFIYLGSGVNPQEITSNPYELDFSAQDGDGTLLNRYDVFSGQSDYTVANGTSYAEQTLQFKKLLALAHFELKFPDGVSLTDGNVTISGENLKSKTGISLADGSLINAADGTVTVTGTNGDFYITMIPAANVTLTFTTTINGVEWAGTLEARTWSAGQFVRKAHEVGVPVEMVKVEDETAIKFVDLGLPSGTLWADRNLGATSVEATGGYYQYGALEPLSASAYDNPVTYEGVQSYYYEDIEGTLKLGYEYTYSNGYYKSLYDWATIEGDSDCDAVTHNFGEGYHLPNPDNFYELVSQCTWTLETTNGVKGYRVIGKNGNSIFIPQCGALGNKQNLLDESIGTGYYWLSWIDMHYESNRAVATVIGVSFSSQKVKAGPLDYNQFYLPIRGVKDN